MFSIYYYLSTKKIDKQKINHRKSYEKVINPLR